MLDEGKVSVRRWRLAEYKTVILVLQALFAELLPGFLGLILGPLIFREPPEFIGKGEIGDDHVKLLDAAIGVEKERVGEGAFSAANVGFEAMQDHIDPHDGVG